MMNFGLDDNIIWVIALVFVLLNCKENKQQEACEAKVEEKECHEEPCYIYRRKRDKCEADGCVN